MNACEAGVGVGEGANRGFCLALQEGGKPLTDVGDQSASLLA